MFESELLWGTLFLAVGIAHLLFPQHVLGANAKLVMFGSTPEDRAVADRHLWLTRSMGVFFLAVAVWLLLDSGLLG